MDRAAAHSRADEVDDGADRAVLVATLEPDGAERREPLGDANSEPEVVATLSPTPGEGTRRPRAHRDGHLDGADVGDPTLGSGSLKMTINPSPVNRSSVPPKRKTRSPIAAWYSLRTRITSSGSLDSEEARVLGGRSQNTTTTSRRWLSRSDSSPESRTSSAT